MAESRRVWRRRRYWVGWGLAAWLGSMSLLVLVVLLPAAAGSKHTPPAVGIPLSVLLGAFYGVLGFIFYRTLGRPRLVADSGGLSVRNAFHEYAIPWSSIKRFSATDEELTIIRFDGDPVNVHAVRFRTIWWHGILVLRPQGRSPAPSSVAPTLESFRVGGRGVGRIPAESLALGDNDIGHKRPIGRGVDDGLDNGGRRFSIHNDSAPTVGAVDRRGIIGVGALGVALLALVAFLVGRGVSSPSQKRSTATSGAVSTGSSAPPQTPSSSLSPAFGSVGQTIAITPDAGLHNRQVVHIVATGYTPGRTYGTMECNSANITEGDCDTAHFHSTTADSKGVVTLNYIALKGPFGRNHVVCDTAQSCFLGVAGSDGKVAQEDLNFG